MQPSTVQSLQSHAAALLTGTLPRPNKTESRAMAIAHILQDGEWHTSVEIATLVGIGQKYTADLLRAMQEEWGLISSPRRGWRLGVERN